MAADEFLFDVEKWFADVVQQRMSFSEKGVYLDMLFQEWRMKEKSLPDDPQAVADLLAVNDRQIEEVLAAWPSVRRKFVADRRTNGEQRIYNVKLEKTRREQAKKFLEIRNRASHAGKASAAKRASDSELGVNGRSTDVEHLSTVRLGKERLGKERLGKEGITPVTARSGRPIFTGQRVTVFEWMFDNLDRILGEHAQAFDLHEWFFALDKQAIDAGLVIPKRDGGAWLEAQLVAEAQRRGLNLRLATATPDAAASKRVQGLVRGGEAFLSRQKAGV